MVATPGTMVPPNPAADDPGAEQSTLEAASVVSFTPIPHPPRSAATPWTLYGSWQRWTFLAVLFLVTTSNYFDYFILSVLLDPIKREFHVSDSMLGLLSGFCFSLCYAIAALPVARWADTGNRRSVITLALSAWSAMTVLCGMAQTFGQLVVARVGVGLTEPGAMPPAQSLIVDYFPPERRAMALTIVTQWGAATGALFGIGLGGYIAAKLGWRMAFVLAGAPGIVLAIAARFMLAEPRRKLGFIGTVVREESFVTALKRLLRKRSYLYMLVGTSVFTLSNSAMALFLPSYLIRSLHTSSFQVSTVWGVDVTIANLLGALVGGWSTDLLSTRDTRWHVWLPAGAFALAAPVYALALTGGHLWSFICLDFMAEFLAALGIAVVFPAVHAVCGNRRRALAIAVLAFSFTFIGMGFGPLFAGMLSDAFQALYGAESLRYSLVLMLFFLLPAAAAFWRAGRTIHSDLET